MSAIAKADVAELDLAGGPLQGQRVRSLGNFGYLVEELECSASARYIGLHAGGLLANGFQWAIKLRQIGKDDEQAAERYLASLDVADPNNQHERGSGSYRHVDDQPECPFRKSQPDPRTHSLGR